MICKKLKKMKGFKNLKIYLYIIAIIAITVILILNKFLVYGLVFLGLGFLGLKFWQLLIKSKEDEIFNLNKRVNDLVEKVNKLDDENKVLRNRKLTISDLNSILDLGLIEVNTNFTRILNKEIKIENRELRFLGALKVDLKAKYGINLNDLKFKYLEAENEIWVANAKPRFLSFGSRKISWEIDEMLEYKKPLFATNHWGSHPDLDKISNEIKEEYRIKIEEETEVGPEELLWILKPLEYQIEKALSLMLGNNQRKIVLVDNMDDHFFTLSEFESKKALIEAGDK